MNIVLGAVSVGVGLIFANIAVRAVEPQTQVSRLGIMMMLFSAAGTAIGLLTLQMAFGRLKRS